MKKNKSQVEVKKLNWMLCHIYYYNDECSH